MTQTEEMEKAMAFKNLRRSYLILVATIACSGLLNGTGVIQAQEDDPPKPSDGFEQHSPSPDEQAPIRGYPVRKRRIGGPTDVEWDLDNSFPQRGSVLELILSCPETKGQGSGFRPSPE
jgi:hypothetical protein